MGQRAAWFGAAVDRAVERIGRAASWLTLAIALLMAANVLLPSRIYGVVANYQWLAIPLFVFMGVMLEKSRLAEDLLDVIGHLAGGLRGGRRWASSTWACGWGQPPASSAPPSSRSGC